MSAILKKSPYRFITLFAICIFGMINSELSLIGVLPYISEAFSITQAQSGYLLTVFAFTVCLFGPISIALFSHYNIKGTVIFCLSVLVLSSLITIFSTTYIGIMISRILPAFVHTLMWSIFLTLGPACLEPHQKAKAISFINIGSISAIVIGMPVSYLLTVTFNWKSAFIFSALMDVFAIILVGLFFPSLPKKEKKPLNNYFFLFKNFSLVLMMLSATLIFSAMYSLYTYWSFYLKNVSFFNHTQISIIFFLFGFMGYIGNYLLGRYIFPKNLNIIFFFILLILFLSYLAIFSWHSSFIAIIVFSSLWGGFQNSIGTVLQPFVTQYAGSLIQFANGLFISFINLGIAIGSSIGAYIQLISHTHFLPIGAMILIMITFFMSLLAIKMK